MMRKTLWSLMLSVALAASLSVERGQAQTPLAVTISGIRMAAHGRVRFDVLISGLQPELRPTVEGTANLGGQTIHGDPGPVVASRIPAALDLPAGRIRVGGDAAVAEFAPVPPLRENMPVTIALTVRQGDQVASARETAMLLLPTVIVPGYLNDMSGKPNANVVATLQQRGYRPTGGSPDLFWFTYPSRSLDLDEAARALAAYVRDVVLPATYADRINVVGYSLGGLLVRWNMAFETGWDRLVNRFVMVGVPNEGVVMSYVDGWYLLAGPWARTKAARTMTPTFPFWRADSRTPWSIPPDAQNPSLAELNKRPLPDGVRVYAYYGDRKPDPGGGGTWAGVTGNLPNATFSYGAGDGIVLAASALGLSINGGAAVPGLADRLVMKVDLGSVPHLSLLDTAIPQIADALTDRGAPGVSIAPPNTGGSVRPNRDDAGNGARSLDMSAGFLTMAGGPR
jgi:hypothetical protein